ncbi:DUF2742 domain-containing protein [Gordonia westfalica]|uniref:DUF2742 domain-containing protein n=1 Tax=Gordonia westfalica TaxID=158898 RepID=A0ABU2GTQ5_9ACTN|nr:DUF2742 domain-containing protein [Gordonia westfalica]MDS1114477.1 DUF2742 domain-containing protein [Gordonia westfalica]
MTDPIRWEPVHAFVGRLLAGRHTTITAGTEEWIALPDDDPAKTIAVLTAGSRWCLEQQLDQIDQRRAATKDAAVDIAQARDWSDVARRVRARDQFRRDNPDLRRKKVS